MKRGVVQLNEDDLARFLNLPEGVTIRSVFAQVNPGYVGVLLEGKNLPGGQYSYGGPAPVVNGRHLAPGEAGAHYRSFDDQRGNRWFRWEWQR